MVNLTKLLFLMTAKVAKLRFIAKAKSNPVARRKNIYYGSQTVFI
jgi:hypothetical protein